MTVTYTIFVERGSAWDQSYDVYAKYGATPFEPGDGIFIDNYPIDASADIVEVEIPVPTAGTWGFLIGTIMGRELTTYTKVAPS